MFRIAHLSDVHLSPLPPVSVGQLLSKRITGYLNWKLNRRGELRPHILIDLIAHLKAQNPDHIAVTGDLVNLALSKEIETGREWLDALGAPTDVSFVPGNHDAYVPGALARTVRAWRPYLVGDDDKLDWPFPFRRDRGNVALIGVNTGQASAPFMATGVFNKRQERATRKLLEAAREDGQFRIIMIHHPPFENATVWTNRLIGQHRFRKMIIETGAELILHGHTHIASHQHIEGPGQAVPVIGVPTASKAPTYGVPHLVEKEPARYNLFDIDRKVGQWSCIWNEYGYVPDSPNVQHISTTELIQGGALKRT